uniref:Putative conserved secreted protein n=1 Tax=Rhipicephalus microplus TaxID=6941 RepID=A0A6M2CV87_RHIMP
MACEAALVRLVCAAFLLTLCFFIACEASPQEKQPERAPRPLAGGRVAVHAASPLPEMAYVRQRPFKDSLRVKKNGGPERFFDKDVDAFFVNND